MHRYHDICNGYSFLSNYVTQCKEERCKTNGHDIQKIQ